MIKVTVLPVPGGPWINVRGVTRAFLTALIWKEFSSGWPYTDSCFGIKFFKNYSAIFYPRILKKMNSETAVTS